MNALALERVDKNHGQGSGKSKQLSIHSVESPSSKTAQSFKLSGQRPLERRPLSSGARWRPCHPPAGLRVSPWLRSELAVSLLSPVNGGTSRGHRHSGAPPTPAPGSAPLASLPASACPEPSQRVSAQVRLAVDSSQTPKLCTPSTWPLPKQNLHGWGRACDL